MFEVIFLQIGLGVLQALLMFWMMRWILRWTGNRQPYEMSDAGGTLRFSPREAAINLTTMGFLLGMMVMIAVGSMLFLHADGLGWLGLILGSVFLLLTAYLGWILWHSRHVYFSRQTDLVWNADGVLGPADINKHFGTPKPTRNMPTWEQCRYLGDFRSVYHFLQGEDGSRVYWSLQLKGWQVFEEDARRRAPWIQELDEE